MHPKNNPFWLLDVSLDDDMETIEERVEELEDDDPNVDWKAISQRLRKPQERVRCEVAWLPGIDSILAQQLVAAALKGERLARDWRAPLAETNLRIMRLASSLKIRNDLTEQLLETSDYDLTEQLLEIADYWERVDAVAVTQQINAHRNRAGMLAMATHDRVQTALKEQQAWMNKSVVDKLNRLPKTRMIKAVRKVCENATSNGKVRAPEAVREWIAIYEQRCEGCFGKQKDAMSTHAKRALKALNQQNRAKAEKIVRQFCCALGSWDSFAQPIQLIYQGEGTTDPETENVFEIARDFTLSLYNEHGAADLAARVLDTQRKVFKEAERLDVRLEQDEETLSEILLIDAVVAKRLGRIPSIQPYKGNIDGPHSAVVEVTDEHIRLGSSVVHPNQVTRMRWGGVTGTFGPYYDIWIDGGGNLLRISTGRSEVYENVVDRLLHGCGSSIASEFTKMLLDGEYVTIGGLMVNNQAAFLTKHRFIRANEMEWVPWCDTVMASINGEVIVAKKEDTKMRAIFSLRENWNGVVMQVLLAIRQETGRSTLTGL